MGSTIFVLHETRRTCARRLGELSCRDCRMRFGYLAIRMVFLFAYLFFGQGIHRWCAYRLAEKGVINSEPSNRNVTTRCRCTFVSRMLTQGTVC